MIDSIHQSMVNTWLRCGVQFERRYINGEVIPPGIAARRGSATHKGAEINNKNLVILGESLPLDDLRDATRDEYMRLVKEEGVFIPSEQKSEANALLNDGLNQSLSSIEKYYTDVAPIIKPIGAEAYVKADIGLDLPIAGTIDLSEKNRIRDMKIKGRADNQEWADREIQPSFYYELFNALYGYYPDEFIYDEIVPLKTKTNYVQIPTKRDREALERWKLYLRAFLRDLNAGIFRPAEPGHFLCSEKWCGYFKSCPYARGRISIAA